jgi:transposase
MHEPSVSIWTVDGRQSIPFVCGRRHWELLQTRRGETDLVYIKGSSTSLRVCDVEEPTPDDVEGVLGVDLGIVNIATDSDGNTHSVSTLNVFVSVIISVAEGCKRLARKIVIAASNN